LSLLPVRRRAAVGQLTCDVRLECGLAARYPVVTEIAFVDAGRTRAEVAVTIAYSGATVVLEKEGGSEPGDAPDKHRALPTIR